MNKDQQRTILTSQTTDEWYTPAWLTDLAHEVMGGIELDPASNEVANTSVKAERFFSERGLERPWTAQTLFLNPPYNGSSEKWSQKACQSYHAGDVQEAILLVYAKLGYNWFEDLWNRYPTHFLRKRVTFWHPDRKTAQAKHASTLIYLGKHPKIFAEVFRPYGRTVMPEVCDDSRGFLRESIMIDDYLAQTH